MLESDSAYTDFEFAPSYVERFVDGIHGGNLIFCNSEGKIGQKSFVSGGSFSWYLWETENNETIGRATASSNGKLWAAFG